MPSTMTSWSPNSRATSGNQGNTMFPAASSTISITANSISEVNATASVLDTTTVERGKYTLLMRLPWASNEPVVPTTPLAKRFQGISPVIRYSV